MEINSAGRSMGTSGDDDLMKAGKKELFDSVMCDMTHEEAVFHLINARLFVSVMAINLLSPDDWEDIKEESPHAKDQLEKAFIYRELLSYCVFKVKKRRGESDEVGAS